jgi:dephospho-CoA kinase
MLRVGLTGGLGSGKSTVAGFLRELGAEVVEADALGRTLMEPGERVYEEIVQHFGREVVDADGRLDRARLAELAFKGGRLNELNAIVHPAVIEEQQRLMDEVFRRNPAAVAVLESALIFEVVRDAKARGETESVLADWRRRIDRVIVVTAPDDLKIARYVAGSTHPAWDARPRRPMRGCGWRTRFRMRKRPPKPIMCLKTPAIGPRWRRRWWRCGSG